MVDNNLKNKIPRKQQQQTSKKKNSRQPSPIATTQRRPSVCEL